MANTRAKKGTRKNAHAQSNGSGATRTTRATRARKAAVNYAESDSYNSESDGDARPAKRARKNNAEQDASDGEGRPARPGKKPVPHRRGLRGKAGGLAAMPDMPLDIVNNILDYLGPQELLNLTRTNKDFRALLLDSSYARLWKNSFRYVEGLPECPRHLSPPAYANLTFSPHCHNCLKNNVQSILWEFGVRYCSKCKETLVRASHYLPYVMIGIRDSAPEFLNSIHIGNTRCYHQPQVDAFVAAWQSLQPPRRNNAMPEDVEDMTEDDEDMPEDDEVVADDDNDDHEDAEDPKMEEVRLKLILEWKARTKVIQDHAYSCIEWIDEQWRQRAKTREDVREARLQAIIDKLREEGFDGDLDIMRRSGYRLLSNHKHARQPHRLTERAWQNMRDELVGIMEDTRSNRLAVQRKASLQARLTYLQEHLQLRETFPRTAEAQCVPQFLDFVYMAEFRELVEGLGTDKDACKALKALLPRVPEFVQRWQEEAKCQLSELAKECVNFEDVPEGVDPLQLATVWFKCKRCGGVMEYPTVVVHRCNQSASYRDPQDKTPEAEEYRNTVWLVAKDSRWPVGMLSCSTSLHRRARMLLKACGKDPLQTTKHDMDGLNERFRCKALDRSGTQLTMSWRAALFKLEITGSDDLNVDENDWQVIAATERVKADELEYNGLPALLDAFQSDDYRCKWSCTQCNDYNATRCNFNELERHVQRVHGIQNPSIPNDIFLDACAKHRVPTPLPVRLISRSLPLESLTANDKTLLRYSRASFYDFPAENIGIRAWRVLYDATLKVFNHG